MVQLLRPNSLQRCCFFDSFESFDAAALATKKARDGDSRCVVQLLRPNSLQRCCFFDSFESFDDVANFDVIEVFKAYAALIALDHFFGVVLEALEG